jgi:non-specific serine/threonine protein kinase/serine/threonine-protein kinase
MPVSWDRVDALFQEALARPAGERSAFVRERCGDDPELLTEVESLLEHHDPEFLESPNHIPPRDEEPDVPDRIGPYRILRTLGRGGMGEVFLAEQEEPIRREVALKLIKLGMDTREMVARFEAERQALALMNHPNIATVYEAGATERGRPYFVMEYVPGVPVTTHCDEENFNLQQRLDLFTEICSGVQHAHQKGLIHRDIKPSNVLVTQQDGIAVPKIIDFGIARAVGPAAGGATLRTVHGELIGTPEYMSPEQAALDDRDVDTRTDVYSLGVLLYELLAGALPFDSRDLRASDVHELRRKIREVEPPRPSVRVGQLATSLDQALVSRGLDAAALSRLLRGDLDWIVLKALEKERDRRYPSVSELATDVRRYLDDEPVAARPPSTAYRVRKFVRRHRLGVVAATAVALALVAGIVGTTTAMIRAQRAERIAVREADTSEQVVRLLIGAFRGSDPSRLAGDTMLARDVLDAAAAEIDETLADRPEVRGRLLAEMGKTYRELGLFGEAAAKLQMALDDRERAFGGDSAEVATVLNELAGAYQQMGRYEQAAPRYREALEIVERVHGPEHHQAGQVLKNLGDCYVELGRLEDARNCHERALRILEATEGPESKRYARALGSFGSLLAEMEDFDAAIPILERSLELRKTQYPEGHTSLAFGNWFLGDALLEAGRSDAARASLERALAIWEPALGPGHDFVATCTRRLAEAVAASEDPSAADALFRRGVELEEAIHGPSHEHLAEGLAAYAKYLRDVGRDGEAGPIERRADAIVDALDASPGAPNS